jgi:hypothetical protein
MQCGVEATHWFFYVSWFIQSFILSCDEVMGIICAYDCALSCAKC